MSKKRIQPGEKIGLNLTAAERKLVLEKVVCLDDDYEDAVRSTPSDNPVMMTLDELEDFGAYIAFEANHAADKKLQKKLDAVFQKIQKLLDTHTDEGPPTTLKIGEAEKAKMIADQAAKLAEWAATALVTAKLLRIENKPVRRFPLKDGEREFLATLSPVTPNLKKKLAKQDSEFTVAEVASLTMAVAESLLDAEPKQQVALLMVAKSLMDCLQERIAGADEPARPKTKPTK